MRSGVDWCSLLEADNIDDTLSMDPVDALLEQAHHLLGTPSAVTVTTPETFAGQLADMHPPSWEGDASTRAAATTGLLDTDRNKIHTAHQSVGTVVTTANEIGQRARNRLDAVTAAWRQDKATLAHSTDTPEGQAALLRAGQQRVADATQIVEGAAADYRQAAGQVHSAIADLPTDGVAGHPKDSPPATPLDSHKWKPGDPRHFPYNAGKGGLGPPNSWGSPPWVDVYDRTRDPDQVPHSFVRSDEIPGYKTLPPGSLGPPTVYDEHGNPDPYVELAPNTGIWVPESDFPGAKFYPPGVTPNPLPPYGYEEWLPGSGIYMWHGDLISEPYNPSGPLNPPQTYPQGGGPR